jgi:hypothetical protein
VPIEPIIALLQSKSTYAKLGACQALAQLKTKAAPAVAALRETLKSDDLWLRVKAADALAAIGTDARVAADDLLQIMIRKPGPDDPRAMEQRYLCFALFDGNGLLGKSLDGIDRKLLFAAIRAGLNNQDGRARGSIANVYTKLTDEELATLMPDILKATAVPSPSGEMFADGIRVAGLKVMTKLRIAEGLDACVDYIAHQNKWASEKRTPELLGYLKTYGVHAQSKIPELEAIAADMDDGEPNFPTNLSKQKAADVRKAIEEIRASTEKPELKRIR